MEPETGHTNNASEELTFLRQAEIAQSLSLQLCLVNPNLYKSCMFMSCINQVLRFHILHFHVLNLVLHFHIWNFHILHFQSSQP